MPAAMLEHAENYLRDYVNEYGHLKNYKQRRKINECDRTNIMTVHR